MWPGNCTNEYDETLLEPVIPPIQASAANWAAPLAPSFPGLPSRCIRTPGWFTRPPSDLRLHNQENSSLTSGGFEAGRRLTEKATLGRAMNLAAFSRFGPMLWLQPSEIELGQRSLSNVSRPDSVDSHFVQPDSLFVPIWNHWPHYTFRYVVQAKNTSSSRSHITHQKKCARRGDPQFSWNGVGSNSNSEGAWHKTLLLTDQAYPCRSDHTKKMWPQSEQNPYPEVAVYFGPSQWVNQCIQDGQQDYSERTWSIPGGQSSHLMSKWINPKLWPLLSDQQMWLRKDSLGWLAGDIPDSY